jgi:hypothetical protein
VALEALHEECPSFDRGQRQHGKEREARGLGCRHPDQAPPSWHRPEAKQQQQQQQQQQSATECELRHSQQTLNELVTKMENLNELGSRGCGAEGKVRKCRGRPTLPPIVRGCWGEVAKGNTARIGGSPQHQLLLLSTIAHISVVFSHLCVKERVGGDGVVRIGGRSGCGLGVGLFEGERSVPNERITQENVKNASLPKRRTLNLSPVPAIDELALLVLSRPSRVDMPTTLYCPFRTHKNARRTNMHTCQHQTHEY